MDAMVLSGRMLFAAALGCVGLVLIAFSAGVLVAEGRPGRCLERRLRGEDATGGDSGVGRGPGWRRRRMGRARTARDAADAIADATREMRAAAEEVLRDLEKRSAAASRILEEAETKIARLKEMLAEHGEPGAAGDVAEGLRAHVEDPRVRERRALVFSLADEGMSVAEIARRVGIGRGEAQLILDLRAGQRAGARASAGG